MAGTGVWIRLLERHRARLSKDPDMKKVIPKLIKRGFFSNAEERQLAGITDASERTDLLLDKLSRDPDSFREFCMALEECAPHLLTELLLDRGEIFVDSNPDAEDQQALQLEFELALRERDEAVRDQEQTWQELAEARQVLQAMQAERDRAVDSLHRVQKRGEANSSGSSIQRSSLDLEGPHLVEESGDSIVWQIHKVTLQRVANYGFGIAVSGGYDSPHFASGDPSIAISDVLKAGPAEGKLQLNDRIISANGISLENVSHSMAIQVLKNSGDIVHLVIRRRVVMPTAVQKESPPLKVTLIKKGRKDEFGLVLGCRIFIQDIIADSLAAQDGALKVGDNILKINNTPLEGLSVTEVKKLIEKSKDRLQLIVSKTPLQPLDRQQHNSRLKDDEGYSTYRPSHDKDDVNVYRPGVHPEQSLYPGEPPPGLYPAIGHAALDGRYSYEQEAPAPSPQRQPHSPPRMGDRFDGPLGQAQVDEFYGSAPPMAPNDGYYSDHDGEFYRGHPDDDMFGHPHSERYVGLRSDIRTDMRRVAFVKDRQKGLGLRLAGGNATGIFIASVQPGSDAELEGLVEGDQILQANGMDIVGLTREEAVAYLTGLEGQVTLIVQYRKEDYDSIMASHEAGDSFYIRTHFTYQPNVETGEHSFKVGDIFHIKDTLFRGVGGSWLAIRVGPNGEELKKGTIPNRNKAESIASMQQGGAAVADAAQSKKGGSLFKRKSARRFKSLGKDHWEDVVFSGLATKFPPYERVVLRDPAFVRPVVIFGAIADVARDMLLKEYPDRFESLNDDKAGDDDAKKVLGVPRISAIREAIGRRRHCVLDITPYHVDLLNYAQYYPIVIFLRGESKQAIKEVRSRWRGSGSATTKNPKKLQELNERMEALYSHLFTGVLEHKTTDTWFLKLMEMVSSQQQRPVWMSEKKPEEDFSDDLMFPMPSRHSLAGSPDTDLDLGPPPNDLKLSPTQKTRLVRSSSDPSINTGDRVPGIPPYPAPPGYKRQPKLTRYGSVQNEWDDYRNPVLLKERRGEWQVPPDDQYYPQQQQVQPDGWSPTYPRPLSHPRQEQQPFTQHARSNIDVYATITPSERLRHRTPAGGDAYRDEGQRSPRPGPDSLPVDSRGYVEGPAASEPELFNRYMSRDVNKHDDSKLRDKFGALQTASNRERAPGSHDPYRFTRSTANPVSSANIDRAKLSHLQARYRQGEGQSKGGKAQSTLSQSAVDVRGSTKMKDPPPVPVKTYSLKEVSMEPESSSKDRNYENSNRSYNYSDHRYPPTHHEQDPNSLAMSPHRATVDSPYEYISSRNVSMVRQARDRDVPPEVPPPPREDVDISRSYANSVYMDHREVERSRLGGMGAEPQGSRMEPGRYTRPRTDDEQLRDLQQHGLQKSPSQAEEQGRMPVWEREQGVPRHNKYKSWDSEKEGQRTFDTYKKLITPGFYGARSKFSQSHTELREESSNAHSSAFEAYKKSSEFSDVASGQRQSHWPNKLSAPQSESFTVASQYDYSLEAPHTHIPPPPPPTIFTELPPPSFPLPQPLTLPIAAILTIFPADKVRADQKVNGRVRGHGRSHSTGTATDSGQGWSTKRVVESGHSQSTGKFAESGQGQNKVTDNDAGCSDHRQGQTLSNGKGCPDNSRAKSHWYSQLQWDESSEREIVPRRQGDGWHAGTYSKRSASLKDKTLSSDTKFHVREPSNFTSFKITEASVNQPLETNCHKPNPGIMDCDENGKTGDFTVTEQNQDTCKLTDVKQKVQSNKQIGEFDIVKKSKGDIGLTGTYNTLESEHGVYNIPSEEKKLFLSNNDQPLRGRSPVRRLLEKRMSDRAKRSRSLDTVRTELHHCSSTDPRGTSVAERVRDIQNKLSLASPPPYMPLFVSRSTENRAQHQRLSQAKSVPTSTKPAAPVTRSKSLDISVPARPPPPYPYGKHKEPGKERQSTHTSREKKLGPIEAYLSGRQEFVSGRANEPAVQKPASDKASLSREQKSNCDEAYLSEEQERLTKLANPQSLSQGKLSHLAPLPPPPPLVTTPLPFEIKRSDKGIQNGKDELDKTVDEGEEYQIDDIDEELGKLTNGNNFENKLTGPDTEDNIKNNEANSKNTESKSFDSISNKKSNGIISKSTSRPKPEFMVNGKAKDFKQAQANATFENGWMIDQGSKKKDNEAESLTDKKEDRSSGKTSLRRLFGRKGAKHTDSKSSRKATNSPEEGIAANSPDQSNSLRQRSRKPIFYSKSASNSQSSAKTDQTDWSQPLPVNSLCTVKHNGCSIEDDSQPVEPLDTSHSKTGDGVAASPGETYTSRKTGEKERTAEGTKDKRDNPDTSEYLQKNGIEMEDGHAVVATARGTFTSAGGVLESKETGVSIVVPEGALEEGESQEIYFKVCNSNSILPPLDQDKGETLLSPLVMCGPHGLKFKKPVELRLPHTASVNPESWSFALKSSDSPSGQPTDWHNMNLAGSEGVTQGRVSQTSVSVLVDHF